jgi:regulation of enolase protein 1 (concanavalin A-like superfamily)
MTVKQELRESIRRLNLDKKSLREKLKTDYWNASYYRFEIYKVNEKIQEAKKAYVAHVEQQKKLIK